MILSFHYFDDQLSKHLATVCNLGQKMKACFRSLNRPHSPLHSHRQRIRIYIYIYIYIYISGVIFLLQLSYIKHKKNYNFKFSVTPRFTSKSSVL